MYGDHNESFPGAVGHTAGRKNRQSAVSRSLSYLSAPFKNSKPYDASVTTIYLFTRQNVRVVAAEVCARNIFFFFAWTANFNIPI